MTRETRLVVFAYDVEDDLHRRRLARVLENHAVRVQKSVFEAWLDDDAAQGVAAQAAAELGPRDSLRVYALGEDSLSRIQVFGAAVRPERQEFYLV
ncbi:MAG: CRISPR-associated endonuclease Cas2 [Deltaproteobacteria bacterium]|nr:CRISPR-associated endonuclease Cas2 [Deltaproteobacteria bacterium]